MSSEAPKNDAPKKATKPKRRPPVAVMLTTAIVVLGIIIFVSRERTPLLTVSEFEQRRAQWQQHKPASYAVKLSVSITGRATENYEIEVRNGRVTSFVLNGRKGAYNEHYPIAGLFDILETELENASARPGSNDGVPEGAILRASFDTKFGFPLTFKRLATKTKSCFIYVTEFIPST